MELDIDTSYTSLFGDLTQVDARNVPESLGDPGRDVTDPFHRGMEPTWWPTCTTMPSCERVLRQSKSTKTGPPANAMITLTLKPA